MPGSKKTLRNQQQRKDREQGIVRDLSKTRKTPELQIACTLCQQSFRATKRNIEMYNHQQQKHMTSTFESCFPGQTYELDKK